MSNRAPPLGRALLADAKADGVEPSRSGGSSNTGYVGVHFDGTGYRVQTRGAFTSGCTAPRTEPLSTLLTRLSYGGGGKCEMH